MLHFDPRSRRFVDTRYLVSADTFFDRARRLCQAGGNVPAAVNYLCDEESWSPGTAGVEPIFTAETVISVAEAILATTRHHHVPGPLMATLRDAGVLRALAAQRRREAVAVQEAARRSRTAARRTRAAARKARRRHEHDRHSARLQQR